MKTRNIRIMYAISLLQGMVFYAPIATLYRQQAGLGMLEIAAIESISLMISIALELPWGMLADRIGYKKSMIACCGMWFLSKIVFWQADGFGMFLAERILLGVVMAGLSGLDQSILYCSARKEDVQRVFGVYANLGTLGVLAAAGVYSLFIGENYRLAGLLTAVSYGLAAILALFLQEVRSESAGRQGSLQSFTGAIRGLFSNRRLLMLVLGCALLAEVNQTVCVFLNQLQYVRCGMSAAAIGLVYIGVSCVELLGGLSAALTRKWGGRQLGGATFALSGAACLILAATRSAWLSVAAIATIHACAALLGPLGADLTNRAIDTPDRVTALSINQLLGDGVAIATNLAFGRLSDASLPAALLFGAAISLLGWLLFSGSQRISE